MLRNIPRLLLLTFGLLAVLGLFALGVLVAHPLKENGLDFQAFYCASKAVAHHANPYLNQPLHDCEMSTSPAFFGTYRNVTVPAPLPPYALALFLPISLAPYVIAKLLWTLLLSACIVLIPLLIVKLARVPLSVAAAASVVAVAGTTMLQLALAPLPIALLCVCALFVREERWNAAAVCAVVAMIEPHVTLPAALALFLFVPALRWRLVAGALVLGALSLIATGPATLVWYFTGLLPAHATSEFNNLGQFSLTTLLYHAGVPGAAALRAGSIQYTLMVIIGIWGGRELGRRYDDAAYLVFVPAVCSVIGGSFIHLSEIAIAVPLACMLARRTGTPLAWGVLTMLAIPWESVFNWAFLAPFASISLLWLVWYRWRPIPLVLLLGALAMMLVDIRLHAVAVSEFMLVHKESAHIAPVAASASSDVTWAAFNALSTSGPFWWVEKSLTLMALALLLATIAGVFRRPALGR